MHATVCALVTALFLCLGACRAAPTDPTELAPRLRAAERVEVEVFRAGGDAYPVVVVDDPATLGELADALDFDGPARHRGPGELATTVAADLRIDAGRSDEQVLLLRADLVWYGPDHAFEVELTSDALYRRLRELVGDPWEAPRDG